MYTVEAYTYTHKTMTNDVFTKRVYTTLHNEGVRQLVIFLANESAGSQNQTWGQQNILSVNHQGVRGPKYLHSYSEITNEKGEGSEAWQKYNLY